MPDLLLPALLALAMQDPAVFRADTHLVQINVIVRDKNAPVTNLNQSDFTITDRGKPRTISIFAVHKPAAAVPAASVKAVPPPPVNTFSNSALRGADAPPSVTMILLDRLNTLIGGIAANAETPLFSSDQALSSAKQHLLKYLDELDPQQRVAIYSLGQGLTVLSDFTGDRARLKSILKNYRATSITSQEVAEPTSVHLPSGEMAEQVNRDSQLLAGMSNAQRAQTTMAALMAVAAHVAEIPGRKNLVWLTADLNIPAAALGRALGRSDIAIYPVDARGLLSWAASHSEADRNAAAFGQTRGTPFGTGAGPTVPRGIAAMQELADETGGRAYVNSNDLTGAIRAAINDGGITYTLGFYVDAKSLDGEFHKLKVSVKRSSLDVRAPRGYFALKDTAETQNSVLAIPMTSPLETSAIRISALVDRARPDFTLTGSIDVRDLQLDRSADSSKGAVEIYIIQQNAAGNPLERRREALQLQLTREEFTASLKSGVVFRTVLHPKEGLTTLRVVVIDRAHSTTGSLIIPISEIK
jgi:VWFA-related protein